MTNLQIQIHGEYPQALPKNERAKVADFYAARDRTVQPLPWPSIAPPFTLFAAIWVRAANENLSWAVAGVLLAGCAVIALHARPNVAVGLYTGTLLAVLWGFCQVRLRFAVPAVLAVAVLTVGGLSYLGLNQLRFGEAAVTHGGFGSSEITYGNVFWGRENSDSIRAQGFAEHGRFNALRIVPNTVMYVFDIPQSSILEYASITVKRAFQAVTQPFLTFIRLEEPRVGIIYLWPVWCLLACAGISRVRRSPALIGLCVAMAVSAGLTLSYATVAFRYRFDLWPLLAVLAMMGAAAWLASDDSRMSLRRRLILLLFSAAGLLATTITAYMVAKSMRIDPESESYFSYWSEEQCLSRAQNIGLTDAQSRSTCRPPPFSVDTE